MKILCELNDYTVKRACYLVETFYTDYDFGLMLASKSYNYTSLTGEEIFFETKKNLDGLIVKVVPYQTFNPWSKVIGYAVGTTIYVNTRKLDLPLADRVENIMHECFHLAGFSHRGNRVTQFNLKTVPYLGGNLFVRYLQNKNLL